MRNPVIVFRHTGFTVHAAPTGGDMPRVEALRDAVQWHGEILTDQGERHDGFSYTREGFPGAVIGALRVRDIAFATKLAARMWIHTHEAE